MPVPAEALCVKCKQALFYAGMYSGWQHVEPDYNTCRSPEAMSPNSRDAYEADLRERMKSVPLIEPSRTARRLLHGKGSSADGGGRQL